MEYEKENDVVTLEFFPSESNRINELKKFFWGDTLFLKASFSFALFCVSNSHLKYLKGIHAFYTH